MLLGASHIGRSSSETAETFAERLKRSGRIVVVDASSEDDLRRLADALALLGSKAIAVGSAGLARHLAFRWRTPAAPAVVLVTSLQDAARRQAIEERRPVGVGERLAQRRDRREVDHDDPPSPGPPGPAHR